MAKNRKKKVVAKPEPEFKFPEKLLNQINECSNGGFILFNFNSRGLPSVHVKCDDARNGLALQKHIATWLQAIDAVNIEIAIQSIATK